MSEMATPTGTMIPEVPGVAQITLAPRPAVLNRWVATPFEGHGSDSLHIRDLHYDL